VKLGLSSQLKEILKHGMSQNGSEYVYEVTSLKAYSRRNIMHSTYADGVGLRPCTDGPVAANPPAMSFDT
jgi:hypothetical protein